MPSTMCSTMGVGGTNPTPDEGILDWIVNHPLESALIILASGGFVYIVYDSMKEKKYVPSKTKSSKSIKSK